MKIITERLIIRNLNPSDIDQYTNIVNSEFVLRFNAMPKLTKDVIFDMLKKHQFDGNRLAIALKETDEMIGEVSIDNDSLRHRVNAIQIGYWLNESYTQKGFMTEALYAVMKHLFDDRGYDIITSRVFSANHASINLLKKLGFKEEGCLKHAVKAYKDVIYDDILFACFKYDFHSR